MANKIWDFDTINEVVPIEDVLAFHGIYPVRGKYRLREDDDTPSASIHPQKKYGNTIHDFGYGNNFNPLTLTMYLQNVSSVEAAQILGEAFNVPPKFTGKDGVEAAKRVADHEWKMLGIYPDMASKNIDFDLEKYGLSKSMELSQRYGIPMSELQEKATNIDAADFDMQDKRWYERILKSHAVPYAYEKRYEYFRRMHEDYELAMSVCSDMDIDKIYQIHKDDYEALGKKLSQIETAMKKATEGTSVKFKGRRYYPYGDFQSVINGEVSFEIGIYSHYEVSNAAYRDKTKVFYCVVDRCEYFTLLENGLSDIHVAARQKGEQVTLSFSSTDAVKVNYLVKGLRGKEAVLAETLGEALLDAQAEKREKDINVAPAEPQAGDATREVREQELGSETREAGGETKPRPDVGAYEHRQGDR